jgi:hypothetical protein
VKTEQTTCDKNKKMFKIIFVFYCVIWQVLPLSLSLNRNENFEKDRIETINQRIVPKELSRSKRNNGKIDERYRWPNATVPVQIDSLVISIFFDFQYRARKII